MRGGLRRAVRARAGAPARSPDRASCGAARTRAASALAGAAAALWCGLCVIADDTELFVHDARSAAASPNILLILATSSDSSAAALEEAAAGLIDGFDGANVGVLGFDTDQELTLAHPVADVAGHRAALIEAVRALSPAGATPPPAAMIYEAALYFMGRSPYRVDPAGAGIGADGRYRTPIRDACQKSHIVYLADSESPEHNAAAERIRALPGFGELLGHACSSTGCLADLAAYLSAADLAPDLPGRQNVSTHVVGLTSSLPALRQAAAAGGGRFHAAEDLAELADALGGASLEILDTHALFAAPAAPIDAFNRMRHRNDVFVTMFQPAERPRWPGNLKRYRLRHADATIIDADGKSAVDLLSGRFHARSRSLWSPTPDGHDAAAGGAAGRLPLPGARNLYTYLDGADLTAPTNAVARDNMLITAEILGLRDDDPSREEVIDFMRGRDVADSNGDSSTAEARNEIGDPLHARPVPFIYGGSPAHPDIDDAVVFFGTNDGYLHAIDAASGIEKWAFVAPEFLADQARLLGDAASLAKHYGIDGSMRLQVRADGDGVIDPSAGEKVYLFFGLRRGGSLYYALDVTDLDAPRLLWRLSARDLPGLGQSWSAPVPTRLHVGGTTQNEERMVVVLGGGYDETQDEHVASSDEVGNAIYIVDSVSGALLWRGGRSDASRSFADMRYSIPADVKVIDLDADGFADRMYAADMGGQIWRFDLWNGRPPPALVTGGVIARLGSAGRSAPSLAETRRFYYAPDVALVSDGPASYLHVGIGSGYRAHPNAADNLDRFYGLRDYRPFEPLSQAEFDARQVITEAALADVTDDTDAQLPPGSPGWYLRLAEGEKVLAEARTFDDRVFFTTFTPAPHTGEEGGCEPRFGTNRLYRVAVTNGAPAARVDARAQDQVQAAQGRSIELQGPIASEIVFFFPSPEEAECIGQACTPPPVGCVGLVCFDTDFSNLPIRTFWREEGVDR